MEKNTAKNNKRWKLGSKRRIKSKRVLGGCKRKGREEW